MTIPVAANEFPLPTLAGNGKAALDQLLKDTEKAGKVPPVFFAAANANEIFYENQEGWVEKEKPERGRINEDTVLHLFSMTKLVTSLVAQGKIEVDDSDALGRYVPELALENLQILEGYDEKTDQAIYRKPKTGITLRMLLTHTAGLFYTFMEAPKNPNVARWAKKNHPKGLFEATEPKGWVTPLLFEPGTSYLYSMALDWAGVLVERISGLSLEDYFQEKMFKPLGLKDTTFIPRPDIMERVMKVYARPAGGSLFPVPGGPVGKPETEAELNMYCGGAGLFGTTREYLIFLQNILACSPKNPNPPSFRLLEPESYELLFTPAIPPTDEDHDCLAKLAEFTGRSGQMNPPPTADTVQHSLGLFLHLTDSKHGRLTGSGAWSGMAKTMFWLDPSSGIASVCNTQLLEENGEEWGKVFNAFERQLYNLLQ
ncbi:hypothetical protein QFC21_002386 [Naganishia friedmannii]|uniref:Uncharacterized protein n=1 Tax=Naganishia friedmannii TaxID=89922 RepID=A0ACC2VXQ2_9TREE|nr:hypothetical protein QFC21_002386 [Naganishia friedmannii]